MKFIYDQLGDWYLSMAGYDWGAGNVQRAVQKTAYADFWELYKATICRRTQNYVPEILAAIIIANIPPSMASTTSPSTHPSSPTPSPSTTPSTCASSPTFVDAPVDELTALNPSLLRMVTPPGQPFDLHLPPARPCSSDQRIAAVPEAKRDAWRYHRVAADDTWSPWPASSTSPSPSSPAPISLQPVRLQGVEALAFRSLPCRALRAHVAHTRAQGRYAGHHRRPLRRLAHPVAPLEQDTGIKVDPGRRLHVAEPAIAASTTRSHRRGTAGAATRKLRRPRTQKRRAHQRQDAAPSSAARHAPAAYSGAAAAKSAPKSARKKTTGKQSGAPVTSCNIAAH